jgi:hypothetical protein
LWAAILQFQFTGEANGIIDNFVPPGTPVSGRFSVNSVSTPGSIPNADSMVYPVDAVILQTGGLSMASTVSFAGSLTISHGHLGFLDSYNLTMKFDIAVGPDSTYTPLPEGTQGGATLSDFNQLPRGTLADITDVANALAHINGAFIIFSPGDYDFPGGSVHLPPVDIGSEQIISFHAVQVPEPGTLVLTLMGLAVLVTYSARRRI